MQMKASISYKTASGNHCCNEELTDKEVDELKVTKPQAVITVATFKHILKLSGGLQSYKTASGNHCCNYLRDIANEDESGVVTKPQAVITVATY